MKFSVAFSLLSGVVDLPSVDRSIVENKLVNNDQRWVLDKLLLNVFFHFVFNDFS